MRVLADGPERFLVEQRREPEFAFHVAKYMPREQHPLGSLHMPPMPPPESPGALAMMVAALPERFASVATVFMPDSKGITRPWVEPLDSPVLVPATAATEVSLQRGISMESLVDQRSLPVPASGERLREAARWVLDRTHPERLLRVALHWAFACEMSHRFGPRNHLPLEFHGLSGPEANCERLREDAYRLVVPQLVRVVAVDAVCSREQTSDSRLDVGLFPSPLQPLIAEFFPCVESQQHPSDSEVRTALWLLCFGSHFDGVGDDAPSMLAAYTFGLRSIGDPEESLEHWIRLVDLPDDHAHGSWTGGEMPSDLRRDLRTTTGLNLRDVARIVHGTLPLIVYMQGEGNQLWTLPTLRSLAANTFGDVAGDVFAFISEHLVTTVEELRDSISGEALYDSLGGDVVVLRKRIETHLHDRPLVRFEDGSIIPVSIPDVVHRTFEVCQSAHNGQTDTTRQRRQRIGRILGHSFEANVRSMCHSVQRGGQQVLDRETVDRVVSREGGRDAKRADVVMCDAGGLYLVIEATKKNLIGAIRYGSRESLDIYIDDYLGKLEQAISTAHHIRAIAAECDAPTVRIVARLVVSELPLRHDAVLAARFDERSRTRNPPFLCSITEFESLVEFGHRGASVPSLIHAWQIDARGLSLGQFLAAHPLA